jgi:peptide/nickel transport system permease protein
MPASTPRLEDPCDSGAPLPAGGGKAATPVYESQARRVWRRFLHHRLAVAGGGTVLVLLLMAILADVITPHDPLALETARRFIAPGTNSTFLLGTDEMGRDLLSRLIYGGRISLVVGVAAMFATVVTGLVIGLISGFYGGRVDNLLMRFTDTMLSFPQVFLLLVLAAFITPTVMSIALIIGLTSWMEVARIIRAQIKYIKEQDFVLAAVALGASEGRIMFKELLPNAIAPVLVSATLNVANAVLMESYISFLGYGIQPPLASWGNMLTNAQAYFDTATYLAVLPGVMITLTVMSFNFLGDGLRDALDPKLRI